MLQGLNIPQFFLPVLFGTQNVQPYLSQHSIQTDWNDIAASFCGLRQTLQVVPSAVVQLTTRIQQVEDVHRPPSCQGRQGCQRGLWVVGEASKQHVDGVTGGVSESHAQGSQEIPAGAATDRVNPGKSHVHCVRSTRKHVVGPAGQL